MKKKQKESAYTLMYAFLALIFILFVVILVNYDKPLVGKAVEYSDDQNEDSVVSITDVLAGGDVQFGFPTETSDQYKLMVGAFDPENGLDLKLEKVTVVDEEEIQCNNGVDDDGDGAIDCFDSDCNLEGSLECHFADKVCLETNDGDADYELEGQTCCYDDTVCEQGEVCTDYLCVVQADPETNCANGLDDDGDLLFDCEDPDCAGEIGPLGYTCCAVATKDEDCGAGFLCYNYEDMMFSNMCLDYLTCPENGECGEGNCVELVADSLSLCVGTELCQDGIDNDLDGLLDMLDDDCADFDTKPEKDYVEGCEDGLDNDQDGKIDCLDEDCSGEVGEPDGDALCEFGTESICTDEFDNDGDGGSDCGDSDCALACAQGQEICSNNVDDDGDGKIDCFDPNCFDSADCDTEDCQQLGDEDGDGVADCDDPECFGLAACTIDFDLEFKTDLNIYHEVSTQQYSVIHYDSDVNFLGNSVYTDTNLIHFTEDVSSVLKDAFWIHTPNADSSFTKNKLVFLLKYELLNPQQLLHDEAIVFFLVPEAVTNFDTLFYAPIEGYDNQLGGTIIMSDYSVNIDNEDYNVWIVRHPTAYEITLNGNTIKSQFFWFLVGLEKPNLNNYIVGVKFDDSEGYDDLLDSYCVDVECECLDNVDNDGDGMTDCADEDCKGILPIPYLGRVCTKYWTNTEYLTNSDADNRCEDTYDNDGDTLIDCADGDCLGEGIDVDGLPGVDYYCEFPAETTCDNGYDDDGDGFTDANDSDCEVQ